MPMTDEARRLVRIGRREERLERALRRDMPAEEVVAPPRGGFRTDIWPSSRPLPPTPAMPRRPPVESYAVTNARICAVAAAWRAEREEERRRVRETVFAPVFDDQGRRVPPPHPGVYAVRGAGGFIKIGKAVSDEGIASRIRSLQCAHPVRLEYLGCLSRDPGDEGRFHKMFEAHRVDDGGGSEWFHPAQEVLSGIAEAAR